MTKVRFSIISLDSDNSLYKTMEKLKLKTINSGDSHDLDEKIYIPLPPLDLFNG